MATTTVNIGAYAARFTGRIGVFKRGVMLKLFSAVIKDTPVGTSNPKRNYVGGRLRANWQFTKGDGNTEVPQLPETDANGGPTIERITSDVQTVDDGDGVYNLVNSLPYANRIEFEGWSHTKAPEGMVRKNLVRIAGILAGEVKK